MTKDEIEKYYKLPREERRGGSKESIKEEETKVEENKEENK